MFYPVHKCFEYKTLRTFNTFLLHLIHFLKGQLIYSCNTFFPIRKIVTGACTAEPLHLTEHRGARQEPRTKAVPTAKTEATAQPFGGTWIFSWFPRPPTPTVRAFQGTLFTLWQWGQLSVLGCWQHFSLWPTQCSAAHRSLCCNPFSSSAPCPLYSDFFFHLLFSFYKLTLNFSYPRRQLKTNSDCELLIMWTINSIF